MALVGCALAVAAALAGYLIGSGDDPAPEPAKVAAGGPLSLELPADWERRPGGAALPPLGLREAVAGGPRGSRDAGIVAGSAERSDGDFLPSGLSARPDAAPEPVRLGRYGAYRHRGLRIGGPAAREVTVYSVPTARGAAILACHAPTAARQRFMPACERVASTLKLRGPQSLSLNVLAAERRRLAGAIVTLRRERSAGRRRLAAAGTPARQAREALALRRAYAKARRSIARLDPAAQAPGWQPRVLASLRRVERGYRLLATAAGRRSRSGFAGARRSVRRSEAALTRLLARAATLR